MEIRWEKPKFGSFKKKLYICIINLINMFEIFLVVILLPASLIFNILLLRRGINFVKRNEQLEDMIREYDNRQDETLQNLELMLSQMREIDLKGSFEADDEVGAVFTQLKDIIETYKNEI